ncbi:hypothetical protein GB937_010145 [Aspergillus fischeri]|nr:hypothetical protein GB937_010145 [Aspergillus fischeri]
MSMARPERETRAGQRSMLIERLAALALVTSPWLLGFHMQYHVSKTRADCEFKRLVSCDQGYSIT